MTVFFFAFNPLCNQLFGAQCGIAACADQVIAEQVVKIAVPAAPLV